MIKPISKFIKIVKRSALMYMSADLEFRTQLISWVIADFIQPILLAVVWSGASKNSDYSIQQVFTYFILMTLILRFTKDFSDRFVSTKIIYGSFSNYLYKPFNYLSEILGISIGSKLIRVLITLPFWFLAVYLIRENLMFSFNIEILGYGVLATILAFLISFLLGNIFALLTFFIKQIYGLRIFYENVVVFMSGEIMPIFTIPTWALLPFQLLPFRYTLSFPVEILGGFISTDEIYKGFIIAVIWLILLVIIYLLLYKIAITKYEGEGI